MKFQAVVSLTIIILTTLKVSFTLLELSINLLENIYSTGVSYKDCPLTIIVQATSCKKFCGIGLWLVLLFKNEFIYFDSNDETQHGYKTKSSFVIKYFNCIL